MSVPRNVICAALGQVLETMYYCQASCAGSGPLPSPAIGSRVTISGERRGEFTVAATLGLAARLAADFVAADVADMTPAQSTEVVHELANVACGATLGALAPRANVTFSIPASLDEDEVRREWMDRFRIDGPDAELALNVVLEAP